jgi:hypothetical protein
MIRPYKHINILKAYKYTYIVPSLLEASNALRMCCWCFVCKTCCCGRNLKDGVFMWAIMDVFFHFFVFPLPILVSEMVFFSPAFGLWIFFLVFADFVVMLGEKSGKPALLTLWLVIFFLNILLLLALWGVFGLTVYLVITKKSEY